MSDETILIVDDNRQIADFIAHKVVPELGYQSLVAYNGKTAYEIIKSNQVSLMILDLQLPDTTGLEFLRRLASEGISIPTILSTAHGSEQVAADAFRLGVEDYLPKPVDPDVLNDAVTRALSESRLRREKELADEPPSGTAFLVQSALAGRPKPDIHTRKRRSTSQNCGCRRAAYPGR